MYTNVFETFFHLNEISVCKDAFVVDLYFREHILCFVFLLTIKGSYILCIIHRVIFQNQKYVHKTK